MASIIGAVDTAGVERISINGITALVLTAADYTVGIDETIVEVTSTAAARAITLPRAGAYPPGVSLTIKDSSGAASTDKPITIAPPTKTVDVDNLVFIQHTLLPSGDLTSDVGTIAALSACTASGTGVGKTLTSVAHEVLTVDGATPAAAKIVLVKDQADPRDNGLYVVTAAGTANPGGSSWVLTRKTTLDQSAELIPGTTVKVGTDGATLDNTVWQLQGGIGRRKSLQIAAPNDTITVYNNGKDWLRRLPQVTRTLIPEGDIVCDLVGAATPTDGTTGANICGPGSLYRCTGTPGIYINTGSAASPAWKVVTHA